MSAYPMLNERPIDQWKVTELKNELQQRNLPVTGLKDDLVKRLSEDIQGEKNTDGETPPAEGLKRVETPGSVDVYVYQASGERNVDEGVSEVTKVGGDAAISVTKSINESLVPTTEASKEPVIGTSENSQKTLDAVTEVEFSLVDMASTDENRCEPNGVGLESASSGVTIVKELNPHSEYHNDIAEKAPEHDTSRKMVVDCVPSDISGISVKLGVDAGRKMVETSQDAVIGAVEADQRTTDAVVEAESSLDDIAASGVGLESSSSGVTTVKEVGPFSECHNDTVDETPEDETSTQMAVIDAFSDASGISIKLTQETFLGTAEASQKTLDVVTEVSFLVDRDAKATKENHCETDGVDLELASIGNIIMKKVNPHYEGQIDTVKNNPKDNTSKKRAVDDDVPSDITSINIKLGVDDVDMKLLEQEAVPTPPDNVMWHADNSNVDVLATPAAEPEDYTGKEMTIDDVLSDAIHANANLGADVDCKSEHEVVPIADIHCNIGPGKVPPPPDAIALHADVVATAESMILKNSFNENALINSKDYEDPKQTNEDCKLILCGPVDQVSEVKLDLASQVKCVPNFHDNVSTNEKNNVMGNLNSDNSDLELEAKQEIVKPFFTIPSIGDCLQTLDGDNELHKNATMEESSLTSNMELDTKEDSPDGPETHLDRSPGDESMDEDLMENMHDVEGKKITPNHVFKEVTPDDTIIEGSSGHTMEVVAKEKPPILTEKRKSEGHEIIANKDQIKRRRQWAVDTVNISDQKASKLTGTSAPKVIRSSIKCSFGRSNSTANGDSPKERIVPPSKKSATTSLRIDRFVRPFTLKAVQELLGKTGSISVFWMDQIKTHCYVTYSSVEEAVATRNTVYNLQWPPNNGSCLVAEFVDPQEVKLKLEPPPLSPVPINPSTAKAPGAATCQQSNASQTIPPHAAATSRGLLPNHAPVANLPPTSDPATARERFPPPPKNLEPALKLDDLFKKTKAYPRIYYMPLSEEEALAKNKARGSIWTIRRNL